MKSRNVKAIFLVATAVSVLNLFQPVKNALAECYPWSPNYNAYTGECDDSDYYYYEIEAQGEWCPPSSDYTLSVTDSEWHPQLRHEIICEFITTPSDCTPDPC
ncbi:hypothetical protein EYV94_11090 [Puteibacter caeruleilacunae]|nr:hypothetical protein EYV94_11090 [Puteibacter caeruleilacunae]